MEIIEPITQVKIYRDPDDNKFLGCTRDSHALYIVSGDKDLLGECKIVCVFGKKYLFFGKNQDMTILIEKEYFYVSSKTTNTTDYCR
jgi:predicted nucleic acid-binding protein